MGLKMPQRTRYLLLFFGISKDTQWYCLYKRRLIMSENINFMAISEEAEFPAEEFKIEVTKEKPFNQCFTCDSFRNGCSGPNLTIMTVERICEFLQLCRIQLGWTYQYTADQCGLSLVTVKRTLTGKNKDPGFATIQALSLALVGDPRGKYPCAMHIVTKETEQAKQECQRLQAVLDTIHQEHEESLAAIRSDDRRTIDYLKEQITFKEAQMKQKDDQINKRAAETEELYEFVRRKNKVITVLALLLAVAVLLILAALVIDRLNGDMGFFWLDKITSIFGGSMSASPTFAPQNL